MLTPEDVAAAAAAGDARYLASGNKLQLGGGAKFINIQMRFRLRL